MKIIFAFFACLSVKTTLVSIQSQPQISCNCALEYDYPVQPYSDIQITYKPELIKDSIQFFHTQWINLLKNTRLPDKNLNLVVSDLSSKQMFLKPISEGKYQISENNERRLVDQQLKDESKLKTLFDFIDEQNKKDNSYFYESRFLEKFFVEKQNNFSSGEPLPEDFSNVDTSKLLFFANKVKVTFKDQEEFSQSFVIVYSLKFLKTKETMFQLNIYFAAIDETTESIEFDANTAMDFPDIDYSKTYKDTFINMKLYNQYYSDGPLEIASSCMFSGKALKHSLTLILSLREEFPLQNQLECASQTKLIPDFSSFYSEDVAEMDPSLKSKDYLANAYINLYYETVMNTTEERIQESFEKVGLTPKEYLNFEYVHRKHTWIDFDLKKFQFEEEAPIEDFVFSCKQFHKFVRTYMFSEKLYYKLALINYYQNFKCLDEGEESKFIILKGEEEISETLFFKLKDEEGVSFCTETVFQLSNQENVFTSCQQDVSYDKIEYLSQISVIQKFDFFYETAVENIFNILSAVSSQQNSLSTYEVFTNLIHLIQSKNYILKHTDEIEKAQKAQSAEEEQIHQPVDLPLLIGKSGVVFKLFKQSHPYIDFDLEITQNTSDTIKVTATRGQDSREVFIPTILLFEIDEKLDQETDIQNHLEADYLQSIMQFMEETLGHMNSKETDTEELKLQTVKYSYDIEGALSLSEFKQSKKFDTRTLGALFLNILANFKREANVYNFVKPSKSSEDLFFTPNIKFFTKEQDEDQQFYEGRGVTIQSYIQVSDFARALINSSEVNQWVYFRDHSDPLLTFKAPNYNIEQLNEVYSLDKDEMYKFIKMYLKEGDQAEAPQFFVLGNNEVNRFLIVGFEGFQGDNLRFVKLSFFTLYFQYQTIVSACCSYEEIKEAIFNKIVQISDHFYEVVTSSEEPLEANEVITLEKLAELAKQSIGFEDVCFQENFEENQFFIALQKLQEKVEENTEQNAEKNTKSAEEDLSNEKPDDSVKEQAENNGVKISDEKPDEERKLSMKQQNLNSRLTQQQKTQKETTNLRKQRKLGDILEEQQKKEAQLSKPDKNKQANNLNQDQEKLSDEDQSLEAQEPKDDSQDNLNTVKKETVEEPEQNDLTVAKQNLKTDSDEDNNQIQPDQGLIQANVVEEDNLQSHSKKDDSGEVHSKEKVSVEEGLVNESENQNNSEEEIVSQKSVQENKIEKVVETDDQEVKPVEQEELLAEDDFAEDEEFQKAIKSYEEHVEMKSCGGTFVKVLLSINMKTVKEKKHFLLKEFFNNYSAKGPVRGSHYDSYEIRESYPYRIDDQLKNYFQGVQSKIKKYYFQ